MKPEHSSLPWPNYWQWTIEVAPCGCLIMIVGFIVPWLLRFWNVEVSWFHQLGAICVLFYLPLVGLTAVNAVMFIDWLCRVGRVTTWKGIEGIIALDSHAYELVGKKLYRGQRSFGTYQVIGGWDSFILRNKENSQLWAIWGRAPADLEAYGIPVHVE